MEGKGTASTALFVALALIILNLGTSYSGIFFPSHSGKQHGENIADLVDAFEGKGDGLLDRVLSDPSAAADQEAIRKRFENADDVQALTESLRKVYHSNYNEATARAAKKFFNQDAGKQTVEARKQADEKIRAWIEESK
jgi:hypothetical protein